MLLVLLLTFALSGVQAETQEVAKTYFNDTIKDTYLKEIKTAGLDPVRVEKFTGNSAFTPGLNITFYGGVLQGLSGAKFNSCNTPIWESSNITLVCWFKPVKFAFSYNVSILPEYPHEVFKAYANYTGVTIVLAVTSNAARNIPHVKNPWFYGHEKVNYTMPTEASDSPFPKILFAGNVNRILEETIKGSFLKVMRGIFSESPFTFFN